MATSLSHLRAFTSTFRPALAPGSASVGAGGSSTTVTPGRLRSGVVSTFATASCHATIRCFLRRHRIPRNGSSAMRTPQAKRTHVLVLKSPFLLAQVAVAVVEGEAIVVTSTLGRVVVTDFSLPDSVDADSARLGGY
jgi:hypothetical protein